MDHIQNGVYQILTGETLTTLLGMVGILDRMVVVALLMMTILLF
jgi:hypothetical protein